MSSQSKGKLIKSGDRNTVLNVFEYFRKCYPDKSVDFLASKTSEATATSKRSVYRFRSEQRKGNVKTTRKSRKKIVYKNSRTVKYDGFIISAIRKLVHSFFKRNIPPTLKHVLVKVNEDSDLPDFKRTTLWRLLIDSGFGFEKRSKNSLLIERDDIILWRHSYLRKIMECRKFNNPIVYVGETWVNGGQEAKKDGDVSNLSAPNEAAMPGLTVSSKEPLDKGPRFVIVHAGCEDGFMKDARMVFLAQNSKEGFHPNAAMFEKWFKEQLLTRLQPNTAIVIDNTTYNSAKVEMIPNASSTKEDIKLWLVAKNIDFPEDSLKLELLYKVDQVKHLYSACVVDEMAQYHGCKVIRLPPHHCELNPIEFAFNQVKGTMAMHNTQSKEELMIPLIDNAFDAVTAKHWRNYCKHVEKTEQTMWEVDYLQDDVEPFISQLNTLSDEGSSDEVSSQSSRVGIHELMACNNDADRDILELSLQ